MIVMFDSILRDTLKIFGTRSFNDKVPDDVWRHSVVYLVDALLSAHSQLVSTTEVKLNTDFSRHSIVEPLFTTPNGSFICEVRIRPHDRFYEKYSILPIPAPRNPKGYSACGICVDIELLRGFKHHKVIHPPKVIMSFEVWGSSERNAFKRMFLDYRKLTELLIHEENFDFFVSTPLPRLEKYKGENIGKKLELYFQKDDDSENMFKIEQEITIGVSSASVLKAFMVLSALYECCYFYCIKKKSQFGRMVTHYQAVKNS
jgi:hypothetical protein